MEVFDQWGKSSDSLYNRKTQKPKHCCVARCHYCCNCYFAGTSLPNDVNYYEQGQVLSRSVVGLQAQKKGTHMEMRKVGVCRCCGWRLKQRQRLGVYECTNSWQTLMKWSSPQRHQVKSLTQWRRINFKLRLQVAKRSQGFLRAYPEDSEYGFGWTVGEFLRTWHSQRQSSCTVQLWWLLYEVMLSHLIMYFWSFWVWQYLDKMLILKLLLVVLQIMFSVLAELHVSPPGRYVSMAYLKADLVWCLFNAPLLVGHVLFF